jgi:hypothetical protein
MNLVPRSLQDNHPAHWGVQNLAAGCFEFINISTGNKVAYAYGRYVDSAISRNLAYFHSDTQSKHNGYLSYGILEIGTCTVQYRYMSLNKVCRAASSPVLLSYSLGSDSLLYISV